MNAHASLFGIYEPGDGWLFRIPVGWKYLLPLSLLNVVITGLATLWGGKEGAALAGLAQLALIGVYVIGGYNNRRQGDETALKPLVTEPVAVAHH